MGFPKALVRTWMRRTNTTQKHLAQALGVSEPTISLVFKGERHLPLDAAVRLADLSGIAVEKLLTGGDAARILKILGERKNSGGDNADDNTRVA